MKIINPATEEIVQELQNDTRGSIDEKLSKLKAGQGSWAETPLTMRIDCICKFSDLLKENIEELALTLTTEMGKPLQQSRNEINAAIGRIAFFTNNSEKYLEEEWVETEGNTQEKIRYEPLGIIANISAWNYPYLVGTNVFIPALIGGNAVFYKPASQTALTGLHIEKLLKQAGVPENVFQTVIGRTGGEMLLDIPLAGYFFTGSYEIGKYIAQKVAHKLVPCQLELGGKDPLYIADDVDVDAAAANAVEGVTYNAGQSCCAVERIYVHKNVSDEFVENYVKHNAALKTGDPLKSDTDVGPISQKPQLDFLEEQITDAVNKGANLLAGGKRMDGKGYFFEPSVLTNVNHSMRIMREESFGPIVGIQKVKDDEEALELMLDTDYGLTSAVFSKNRERALKLMDKLDSGTTYWNCCDRVSPALPWSGRRNSGIGTTLSHIGIHTFVQPKGYHLRTP